MKKEAPPFNIRRIIPSIVVLGAILVTIVIAKMQSREDRDAPSSRQLRWHALEAKKQNKKSVSVPAWQALYAEPDLDEVAKRFTVMVVEAVTTRTFETSNGNRLVTWNKLRILETISSPQEAVNDTSDTPPQEMFPLNRGQILVKTVGGTKLIEGVKVTEPGPVLKEGQLYLIYVLLNSSGVGLLAHGETGISTVAANGHLVPFQKGFDQGDTLDALKNKMKARHSREH